MAKLVGLSGSPRKGGNTEALLTRFLAGAQAAGGLVSKIRVADLGLVGWTPEALSRDTGPHRTQDRFTPCPRN